MDRLKKSKVPPPRLFVSSKDTSGRVFFRDTFGPIDRRVTKRSFNLSLSDEGFQLESLNEGDALTSSGIVVKMKKLSPKSFDASTYEMVGLTAGFEKDHFKFCLSLPFRLHRLHPG